MSHENVVQSLSAVEQALGHFAKSLEHGGFAAGAAAYERMAEVVLSQAMWLQSEGEQGFNEQFRRVEARARDVHRQIYPYVSVMEKLLALEDIVPRPAAEVEPDSLAGQIVRILTEAESPLSMTAIRGALGKGSRVVRAELEGLVKTGVVERTGSTSRLRYLLVCD